MRKENRTITKLTALCLTCSALLTAGCNIDAFVLDFLLPNLLGGSSSLLDPSAIIQSVTNTFLGTSVQTSSSTTTTTPTNTANSPGLGTLGTTGNQNSN